MGGSQVKRISVYVFMSGHNEYAVFKVSSHEELQSLLIRKTVEIVRMLESTCGFGD